VAKCLKFLNNLVRFWIHKPKTGYQADGSKQPSKAPPTNGGPPKDCQPIG
jgi:hypothetical protein